MTQYITVAADDRAEAKNWIAGGIALAVGATDWGEVARRARLDTDEMSRVLFNQFVFPFEIVK